MSLVVYMGGQLVGRLEMAANEQFYGFAYDEAYLGSAGARPLSLSLPLRRERFDGAQALPFFEGLLPEGSVRDAIARELRISTTSPAKLLHALGRDCAGDIAVLEEDDPFQPPATDRYQALPEGLETIARSPLEEIARLRSDNRLSLAGGMEKIGLYHDGRCKVHEGWYVPLAGSPSTHIVKPQMPMGYPQLAYNELTCMRLARAAGLDVADAWVHELDVPLLVVRRFDREPTGETSHEGLALYRRLRQEDFCQALGYPSAQKYEQDGGPGIADLGNLLLRHSSDYLSDRDGLLGLVAFNYLIGNCDAHAKNYSLVLGRGEAVRLSPAYDLVSTTVYDGEFGGRLSRQLGMRIGEHGNIDRVTSEDFASLARDLGYRLPLFRRLAMGVAERVMEVFGDVISSVSNEVQADVSELVDGLRLGIRERATVVRAV